MVFEPPVRGWGKAEQDVLLLSLILLMLSSEILVIWAFSL